MMKKGGLTEDEALSLITINPARQLAIDKYVGSIESGKQADLTINPQLRTSIAVNPSSEHIPVTR